MAIKKEGFRRILQGTDRIFGRNLSRLYSLDSKKGSVISAPYHALLLRSIPDIMASNRFIESKKEKTCGTRLNVL